MASKNIGFTAFCQSVLNFRLSKGQRVLSLVAFDGLDPCQLADSDRELARKIFGDVDTVPSSARVRLALLLGRGSGKTRLVAAWSVYCMCVGNVTKCGPGDLPLAITIAPDKATARLAIRMALEMAKESPQLASLLENETADGFTLRRPDGRLVGFEAFAASRGGANARGRPILTIVLDEAQFFYSDLGAGSYVVNDRDIYRALIPRLLSGGKCVLISTPWPTRTFMGELVDKNFGHPVGALACIAPTIVMRDDDPDLAGEIERERQLDPENTARERDCDRSSDAAGARAIPSDWIVRAFRPPEGSAPHNRVGLLDSSAGSGDSFTWCCLEVGMTTPREEPEGVRCEQDGQVYYLVEQPGESKPRPPRPLPKPFQWLHSFDGVRGKFRDEIGFDQIVERIARHFEALGVAHVFGDQFQAYALDSAFRQHGIKYHCEPWTSQGKVDALGLAKSWFRDSSIYLSAGQLTTTLRDELTSLVVKPLPGGSVSIGARGRGHDDFAALILNAAMIAGRGRAPGSPITTRRRPTPIFQG